MAQSSEQAPFTSEIEGSILAIGTNVKIVSQRSAESHGFSPGAPVSLHTESGQGVLGTVYMHGYEQSRVPELARFGTLSG